MASVEAGRAIEELREKASLPKKPLKKRRAEWIAEAKAAPLPKNTKTASCKADGIAAEWVSSPGVEGEGVLLLLHGGGYHAGNRVTHRELASHLSASTRLRVLVPEYKLAPEHPFPAGLQDCLAAYGFALKQANGSGVAVVGDSAGGGMAAAMMLALRDAGAPMPACAVLMSPWTDILCRGESYEANRNTDPSITKEGLLEATQDYVGAADPNSPLISPIIADLKGLPPLLIHAGGLEAMIDDSTVFADRAKAAGVDVTLEVWPEMWHVWQSWAASVPEAQEAIDKIGAYIKAHLN